MTLRVTVSGSFRRHLPEVQQAVYAFIDAGAKVLSPADPRVVDAFGNFVFVASDLHRAVKVVQSRHLIAIEHSDFLWLVAPDGYVGPSAAMELGYAAARGIPVLGTTPPSDLTMRQFVEVVPSIAAAMQRGYRARLNHVDSALLDPVRAIDDGHAHLDTISRLLLSADKAHRETMPALDEAASGVRLILQGIR